MHVYRIYCMQDEAIQYENQCQRLSIHIEIATREVFDENKNYRRSYSIRKFGILEQVYIRRNNAAIPTEHVAFNIAVYTSAVQFHFNELLQYFIITVFS